MPAQKRPQPFAWQSSGSASLAATRIQGKDEALVVRSIVGVYFGQWTDDVLGLCLCRHVTVLVLLSVRFKYGLKEACSL